MQFVFCDGLLHGDVQLHRNSFHFLLIQKKFIYFYIKYNNRQFCHLSGLCI